MFFVGQWPGLAVGGDNDVKMCCLWIFIRCESHTVELKSNILGNAVA